MSDCRHKERNKESLALTELYCYISPTMKNVGEMVKLLQLSLWNQGLIK
ncbi:MAG: hypothetical protein V7K71_04085 [Nostoc sp.]